MTVDRFEQDTVSLPSMAWSNPNPSYELVSKTRPINLDQDERGPLVRLDPTCGDPKGCRFVWVPLQQSFALKYNLFEVCLFGRGKLQFVISVQTCCCWRNNSTSGIIKPRVVKTRKPRWCWRLDHLIEDHVEIVLVTHGGVGHEDTCWIITSS